MVNWRENIQRVEEEMHNFAVSYTLIKDETERDKENFEMEQERLKEPMA
jgi:hypothetical protein